MAKKKSEPSVTAVTAERAQRLYRLLRLLGQGPQARPTLLRKLRLPLRGFYRDLETLRAVGIAVKLNAGKYHLHEPLDAALDRLPFPDPNLTLGEARLLAQGRSVVHRKIRTLLEMIAK
jgi:hypothetical protein